MTTYVPNSKTKLYSIEFVFTAKKQNGEHGRASVGCHCVAKAQTRKISGSDRLYSVMLGFSYPGNVGASRTDNTGGRTLG